MGDTDVPGDTGWDGGDDAPDAEPVTDPFWPGDAYLHAVPSGPTSVRLEWVPAEDNSQITIYELYQDGALIERTHEQAFSHRVSGLSPLEDYTFEIAARDDENKVTSQRLSTTLKLDVPEPDESAAKEELDSTRSSTAYERHRHLFEGDDPLQRNVEPGSIEERRVSRLTGKVVDEDGEPLAGVHISVHRHPKWGHTLTRPNGEFDLVVNGGGQLTVEYKRDGYLPVHRQLDPDWQSSARLPLVVMLQENADASTVDPSQTAVAQGEQIDGARGSRKATVIFREGTTAEMVLPDDSRQPLTTLDVRITEYTVGDDGPNRMPAELPPTSSYTYASAVTVDQATAAGAKRVEFSQPVAYYLENFLGIPVGVGVPLGFYDDERAAWIPEDSGRVIEILGVDAEGRAEVDIDGSGQAAGQDVLAEHDFTDDELEKLAEL